MANAVNTPAQEISKKEVKKATATKVEPKADKKPKTKKNPLEALTVDIPMLAKTKATSSIYKADLFDGQDDKGKKSIRRKIRRIRDQFLGAWLEAKNDTEKVKGLQKEWAKFASQVYNDSRYIFEKNTSEEDQKLCQDFVKAMAGATKKD